MLTLYQIDCLALRILKSNTSAKIWLHFTLNDTYFIMFRRVQQVLNVYSVINNYILESFKIERTKLFITTTIPIINTSTISKVYYISDK